MFILSSVTYIVGISFYFIFIDGNSNYNNCLLIASFFMLLFFLKYKPNFSNLKSYFCFLFFLGLWISFISVHLNTIYLIEENLDFETIYAEIDKIDKSNYNNKQYLYLSNVVFTSKNHFYLNSENIRLRLVYNRESNLLVGDIIRATIVTFPTSKPVSPFGYNFQKNNIYKKISANGYIVGYVKVIKDRDTFKEESFFTKLSDFLDYIRESFKDNIKKGIKDHVSKDTASFLIAITLGEYSFLPQHHVDSLRNSSLAHLISISGFHVSTISMFLFFFIRYGLSFFTKISLNYDTKRLSAFITIYFLLFYIFIIGNHTPAIRATIMSIAFLITLTIYFKAISFNSLFLAGIIILTIAPYLIFSASFLLSYIATFALIYFCNLKFVKNLDYLSKKNLFYRMTFLLSFSVFLTLFIEISIFPLVAYYFGMLPLNGVFANTLSSPVFSFIVMPFMILYFLTPIFIGKYFLIIAAFGMDTILWIGKFFSTLKFSLIYVDFFSGALLITLLFLYMLALFIKNKYSFLIIGFFVFFSGFYFISPSPDIIIDSTGKTLAIRDGKKYFFSATSDKFVKSLWFKNPNLNYNNPIYKIEDSICEDYHCALFIKEKIVTVSESNKYYKEDCGIADIIIITNRENKKICSSSIVIDQIFLKNKGSTKIYIDKKITVFSVNDNYFSYLMKFILQSISRFNILFSG